MPKPRGVNPKLMQKMVLRQMIRLISFWLIVLLTYPLQAQRLHFIVFADTEDPGLSAPALISYNYLTQDLAPSIAKQAGLTLSLSGHIGKNFRLANLNTVLASLKPGADDVIFFYFIGHGWNNRQNEYPSLLFRIAGTSQPTIEDNSTSLLDLYRKLRGYNARMTIVIGESSNKELANRPVKAQSNTESFRSVNPANPVTTMSPLLYDKQRLQQLFRATRGGLLMSGSKRGQHSIFSETGGWMGMAWQNAFRKVINDDKKLDGEPANWTTIINQVVNETEATARENGAVQNPQFINELVPCPTCLPNVSTAKRYALVIGNSAYQHGNPLAGRPVNDATDMAARLRQLGFTVTVKTDADKKAMERSLRDFNTQIQGAEVALFFYAGHGVEVDGVNYLLPTDAELVRPDDADTEGLNVQTFIDKLKNSGAAFSVAVLDACRDNPFKNWPGSRRGPGDRGFKTISNIAGLGNMYLAMATGWNNVAQNGTGRNGVYTDALLQYLKAGQTLETVFQRTSVSVKQRTQNAQNPQLVTEYTTENKMTF